MDVTRPSGLGDSFGLNGVGVVPLARESGPDMSVMVRFGEAMLTVTRLNAWIHVGDTSQSAFRVRIRSRFNGDTLPGKS